MEGVYFDKLMMEGKLLMVFIFIKSFIYSVADVEVFHIKKMH